jgi:hypothetical protein
MTSKESQASGLGIMKACRTLFAAAMGVLLASVGLAQSTGPDAVNAASAPGWKTISLGTFTSANALIDALDEARVAIGEMADEALHRPAFTVTKFKSDVQLVVLSAAQLGGLDGAVRSEILARGRRLGFELCSPEAAAQLRLQYADQPVGEFLDIAMEPIATYAGARISFSVANGGEGLMLIGYAVAEDARVSPNAKLVFARPLRVAQPAVR